VTQLRHRQPSLWHRGLAKDIEDLWEPWMKEVDQLLEDAALVESVYEAQGKRHAKSRTRGRTQTPAEAALRWWRRTLRDPLKHPRLGLSHPPGVPLSAQDRELVRAAHGDCSQGKNSETRRVGQTGASDQIITHYEVPLIPNS
jgi:hypothetical protein